MNTTQKVVQLAEQMSWAFEQGKRPSGEKFRKLRDGSPDWMTDVLRAAHEEGNFLPEDYRYAFVERVVDLLAEGEEDASVDDLRDLSSELEPDSYTKDLTDWLGSMSWRVDYLTRVLQEYGSMEGYQLLAWAQLEEMREVFDAVLEALIEVAEREEVPA